MKDSRLSYKCPVCRERSAYYTKSDMINYDHVEIACECENCGTKFVINGNVSYDEDENIDILEKGKSLVNDIIEYAEEYGYKYDVGDKKITMYFADKLNSGSVITVDIYTHTFEIEATYDIVVKSGDINEVYNYFKNDKDMYNVEKFEKSDLVSATLSADFETMDDIKEFVDKKIYGVTFDIVDIMDKKE